MKTRSSRRSFNVALGTLAGAAVFGPGLPLPAVPGWEAKALWARLVELVGVPDPRAVGEAYLASLATPPPLSQLLEQAVRSPEDFEAQQAADFAENRWIRVDGWRLAQIDAQLCAVAALLQV